MELDLLVRIIPVVAAVLAIIGGLYKFGAKYGSVIKMRLTKFKNSASVRLKAFLTGIHPTVEQEISRLREVSTRIQEIDRFLQQVAQKQQNLEQTIRSLRENVTYVLGLFQVKCTNVKCGSLITTRIPIPFIKGMHPVDGPPTGKLGGWAGKEDEVICHRCHRVFHIVY